MLLRSNSLLREIVADKRMEGRKNRVSLTLLLWYGSEREIVRIWRRRRGGRGRTGLLLASIISTATWAGESGVALGEKAADLDPSSERADLFPLQPMRRKPRTRPLSTSERPGAKKSFSNAAENCEKGGASHSLSANHLLSLLFDSTSHTLVEPHHSFRV